MLFRAHDVAAALAAVAIALSAWALRTADSGEHGPARRWLELTGATGAALTAACLGLVLVADASDMLYMLPQGGIGIWLVALCARGTRTLGPATRTLGIVAGLGMLLIAGSFVAIAIAQGPELWALSHQDLGEPDPVVEDSTLNVVGHQILSLGTLLALPAYPIWAVLAARAFAARFARTQPPPAQT